MEKRKIVGVVGRKDDLASALKRVFADQKKTEYAEKELGKEVDAMKEAFKFMANCPNSEKSVNYVAGWDEEGQTGLVKATPSSLEVKVSDVGVHDVVDYVKKCHTLAKNVYITDPVRNLAVENALKKHCSLKKIKFNIINVKD